MKQRSLQEITIQTRYGRHLALFEPDERRGYIITVPGLPGVITWGRDIAHGKAMAEEAIELCIESLVEEDGRRRRIPSRKRTALAV